VDSTSDPYSRILGSLDRIRYFASKYLFNCTHEAKWTQIISRRIAVIIVVSRTRSIVY
jgi:hypothetical protein